MGNQERFCHKNLLDGELMQKIRLADLLILEGLLTESQLSAALAEHKKLGKKLGEYLVEQHIVQEEQIIGAISRQLQIPVYTPTRYPVDHSNADLILGSHRFRLSPFYPLTDPPRPSSRCAARSYTHFRVKSRVAEAAEARAEKRRARLLNLDFSSYFPDKLLNLRSNS